MTARLPLSLALVAASLIVGCGGSSAAGLDYPGTPEGGKALVTAIITAPERSAFITKLKPSQADLEALFDASVVPALSAHVDKMFAAVGEIKIKPDQTDVLFVSATSEDFKAEAEPAKSFPGGYAKIAAKLKPGITWYAWKYVVPGDKIGMAYDGLAYVNGHWVWVAKPFRAVAD